jgi:hypothetical protein
VAGELRIAVAPQGFIVMGDVTGDGKADFSIELAGISKPVLTDFIL